MARVSEKTRDKLIGIMIEERSETRCALVEEFRKQADELTVEDDIEIDIVNRELMVTEASKLKLQKHKQYLIGVRDEKLVDANLSNFNHGSRSCGDKEGRPQVLIDFDIETRNLKKEILER